MLVYFFSITYGMYLATMLEYISFNSVFSKAAEYKKEDLIKNLKKSLQK